MFAFLLFLSHITHLLSFVPYSGIIMIILSLRFFIAKHKYIVCFTLIFIFFLKNWVAFVWCSICICSMLMYLGKSSVCVCVRKWEDSIHTHFEFNSFLQKCLQIFVFILPLFPASLLFFPFPICFHSARCWGLKLFINTLNTE